MAAPNAPLLGSRAQSWKPHAVRLAAIVRAVGSVHSGIHVARARSVAESLVIPSASQTMTETAAQGNATVRNKQKTLAVSAPPTLIVRGENHIRV